MAKVKVAVGGTAASDLAQEPSPRERILAAARELFYRHGIHAVGVDAIAAAADTNKMTLYRHFASKDALVVECLRRLTAELDVSWDAIAAAHAGDPEGQLLAWLKHIGEWKLSATDRGCGLANAAVEFSHPQHPARRFIHEQKKLHPGKLLRLLPDPRPREPGMLAAKGVPMCRGAPRTLQNLRANG